MSKSVDKVYKNLRSIVDQIAMQEDQKVSMNRALLQMIASMKLEPGDISWSWRIPKTDSTEAADDDTLSREERARSKLRGKGGKETWTFQSN